MFAGRKKTGHNIGVLDRKNALKNWSKYLILMLEIEFANYYLLVF